MATLEKDGIISLSGRSKLNLIGSLFFQAIQTITRDTTCTIKLRLCIGSPVLGVPTEEVATGRDLVVVVNDVEEATETDAKIVLVVARATVVLVLGVRVLLVEEVVAVDPGDW